MTDSFYTTLRDNTALPLIKKFGFPMTLHSSRAGVIDPNTGATVSEAVEVVTPFFGLFRFYSQDEIDGKDVLASDIQVLAEASLLNSAGITPDTGMQLTAKGELYNVVRNTPTAPGGIPLLFRLQIRR